MTAASLSNRRSICEYLDDCFPTPRLVPQDPFLRARMRLWSKAVDEQLFEATRELSFSAMFRDRMRKMTEEQRQGRYQNVGDPIKRARLISTYEEGVDSPYVFQGIGAFEMAFEKMEKDLRAGGPWLLGADLSLADINMMPFVARMAYLNLLDIWIADRPACREWWARVQTHAYLHRLDPRQSLRGRFRWDEDLRQRDPRSRRRASRRVPAVAESGGVESRCRARGIARDFR